MARPGKARRGKARQGKGYNVAGSVFPEGAIRCGEARPGVAGHGGARQGANGQHDKIGDSEMSDDKTFSWRDGMPTKPDVDALLKRWPEPNIGDRYEYETVAEVIGYEPGSQRFKTVTDAWRRRVHEKGFVIECDPGAAFFVANADQITASTYSALNSSARKLRRQRKNLTIARAENDEQRSTIMHQGRLLAETERHLKKAKMNALPALTADDRPRISPPVAANKGGEK